MATNETKTTVKPPQSAARKRAAGRKISEFRPLLPAEKQLLVACASGQRLVLSAARPDGPTDTNRIRSSFVRFLALGGDERHPVHERGVEISGAFIDGELDISYCRIALRLALRRCNISGEMNATAAVVDALELDGSSIPGIRADRLKCTGTLFLRNGFLATGEVRLMNAVIGGSLNCAQSKFSNPGKYCILADRIRIGGSVHLSRSRFEGCVKLLGANIRGNLNCTLSVFHNPGEEALVCDGARIEDGLFWREVKEVNGDFNLTTCYAEVLVDDFESWDKCRYIEVDGFVYGRIIGFCDFKRRVQWLGKQQKLALGEDFCPQPWEQLSKVLREMGHVEAARNVAIEKHWARARAGKIGQRAVTGESTGRAAYHAILNKLSHVLHLLYGVLAGFGYRPLWTVGWMVLFWLFGGVVYQIADHHGVFGPSNAIIQTSATMTACGAPGDSYTVNGPGNRKATKEATPWTRCPAVPAAYTTFHPYIYSLDLLLPVIDLQQQDAWSPMIANRAGRVLWWGVLTRWLLWSEILFGWLSGALLVAVLGKFVDRD